MIVTSRNVNAIKNNTRITGQFCIRESMIYSGKKYVPLAILGSNVLRKTYLLQNNMLYYSYQYHIQLSSRGRARKRENRGGLTMH